MSTPSVASIARHHHNIQHIPNYLDDCLKRSDGLAAGHSDLTNFQTMADAMKLPLAPKKIEGPITPFKFLGIELDCMEIEARLPQQDLKRENAWLAHYCNTSEQQRNALKLSLFFVILCFCYSSRPHLSVLPVWFDENKNSLGVCLNNSWMTCEPEKNFWSRIIGNLCLSTLPCVKAQVSRSVQTAQTLGGVPHVLDMST